MPVRSDNTLDRLKVTLTEILNNLMEGDKSIGRSHASNFETGKYPSITYRCVPSSGDEVDLSFPENVTKGQKKSGSYLAALTSDLLAIGRVSTLNATHSNPSEFSSNAVDETNSVGGASAYDKKASISTYNEIKADETVGNATLSEVIVSRVTIQPGDDVTATTYRPYLSDLMKLLLNSTNSSGAPCPPLFTPVGNTCLAVIPYLMTWQEAGGVCERLGGQLAEARDANILTEIAKFLKRIGISADFWIGGFFDDVADAWMWRSGSKMIMSTPFWGYRSECNGTAGHGYSPARYNPSCSHAQQAPHNSTRGFCASLDTQFFYFITDHPCEHGRKALCSHERVW
ncbi:uncharacterized protein LOC108679559 isoform X2 [Hyalella azteca]|uniref:Uncharacterized protein LOC108679559 isoform X2 n=1 Tax=Hyalella azteca TaxID=294128 RepID=A0A8B7PCF5_HYAAZ|nr:uncharacterized protein LOC108679559 isoform X2 [Hyalella azteca]